MYFKYLGRLESDKFVTETLNRIINPWLINLNTPNLRLFEKFIVVANGLCN
jgi:hypothetical protein